MNLTWAHIGQVVADFAPALGNLLAGPTGEIFGKLLQAIYGAVDPKGVMGGMISDPEAPKTLQAVESAVNAIKPPEAA